VVANYYMNLVDLETHGYVVVPNFLSKEIVDRMTADYQNELANTSSGLYKQLGIITSTNSHGLDDVIRHLMTQIRAETNIEVDFCHPSADYFNNNDVSYGYHQDHEPYWLWQNSYNALNIWIPLIKNQGDKDGLYIVPMHRVNKYHHLLRGRGARRFVDNNDGSTLMSDDCLDEQHVLSLSLDRVREIPILYPGDALIIRPDTIHASQPKTHLRVAASIRCTNTQGWVDRSISFGWKNNIWNNLVAQEDMLYAKFFQKLAQEFKNKEHVQIQDVVLTKK
jgi:ectoine hydroxylase-related dioxygenase (phytanoyl-CoA dioxygenase family)